MASITYELYSPEAMIAFGQHIGEAIQKKYIILLIGELGAGKTHLAKGIAHGLGIKEEVTSPTFSILNQFTSGRLPLYHFDLYRLEDVNELESIGFYEYIRKGISLIEWADKFPDEIGRRIITISIDVLDITKRKVTLSSEYYSEDELRQLGGA